MKIKALTLSVLAVAVLGACASQQPITSKPVSVSFTGNPKIESVAGYNPVEVRSYRKKGNNSIEFSGASCDVTGAGFAAKLITPGIVNLPDLLGRTQPVTVTCSADGSARTVIERPYNLTHEQNMGAANGNGIVGAIVVGVLESSREKSKDHFGYRNIRVNW